MGGTLGQIFKYFMKNNGRISVYPWLVDAKAK
jgi:hypothetical protein